MASEKVLVLSVEPGNNEPAPSTATQSASTEWTTIINVAEIPRYLFDREGGWVESPITALLGVPLKVVACSAKNTQNGFTGFNYAVQCLFISPEIGSPNFASMTRGPLSGPALIAHCDHVHFDSDRTFNVLVAYINDFFAAHAISTLPEGREKEAVKHKVTMKMSKEAFHAHFEEFMRLETFRGKGKDWKGVKSPVLIRHPHVQSACGLCGKTGGELSACGKCKVRFYCSRECQKEDWKVHKRACGIKLDG